MSGTTTPSQPTLDQRRAQHAWQAVQALASLRTEQSQEYAREAKKLPMRILAAGLGQALVLILAKAKNKKPNLNRLHDDLTDWVIRQRPLAAASRDSLLESIIGGDADFLRRATEETLLYLQWLNRFAEAQGLADDSEGN